MPLHRKDLLGIADLSVAEINLILDTAETFRDVKKLFNIADSELTAGELKTRGHYQGSNVSYNLKKLVDMGYIHYKRSDVDRRSVRVSLTQKGLDACKVVHNLYQRQLGSIEAVAQVGRDDLTGLNRALMRLERFWTDQIRYRL